MKGKRTVYDTVMSLLGLFVLLGTTIFLIVTWSNIPDQVPGHYNAAGVADSMTGKGSIIFELVVGWILFVVLWITEQFPQLWNTGVKVTPANQWQVYHILKNMMVTLRFFMAVIFSLIAIAAAAVVQNLPVWYLFLILAAVFGDIGWSMFRLFRVGR